MLKQLQAATGLVFAAFLVVHLINTWLAAAGPVVYDSVQSVMRTGYQFAPIEALILAAGAVHAVIGVMRWVREPGRELTATARWHRRSAVFLLVFIVGHVLAVRGPSWWFDVYPGFDGLAFSMEFAPYYFYPYYFLLAMAGFFHGLNGSMIALRRLGVRVSAGAPAMQRVSAMAAIFTVVALLALGGVWFDVGPVHESDFAQLGARLFGIELAE